VHEKVSLSKMILSLSIGRGFSGSMREGEAQKDRIHLKMLILVKFQGQIHDWKRNHRILKGLTELIIRFHCSSQSEMIRMQCEKNKLHKAYWCVTANGLRSQINTSVRNMMVKVGITMFSK
jgi:hypothetical protein